MANLTAQQQKAVEILANDFMMDEHEIVDNFGLEGVVIFRSDVNRVENNGENHFIVFRGERLTLTEWGDRLGIDRETIKRRLDRGKSIEEALTLRARKQRNNTSTFVRKF